MKALFYSLVWASALIITSFSPANAQRHSNFKGSIPIKGNKESTQIKGNKESTQTCRLRLRIIRSDINLRVTEPNAPSDIRNASKEQQNLGSVTLIMNDGYNYSVWEGNPMDNSPENMNQQNPGGTQNLQFRVRTENATDAKSKSSTKTVNAVQLQRGKGGGLQVNGDGQPTPGDVKVDILPAQSNSYIINDAERGVIVFIAGAP